MTDTIDEQLNDVLREARDRQRLPSPAKRRALRERAGVSQSSLAQLLGTSAAAVSRWESGHRTPRSGARLAAYLHVLDRLREAVQS